MNLAAGWMLGAGALVFALLPPYMALSEPYQAGVPLWQVHGVSAFVCGSLAAFRVSNRRPFLYGLFIVMALLIPLVGGLFVTIMGMLARRESSHPATATIDSFVCGIPLRSSERSRRRELSTPFVAGFRSLSGEELEVFLNRIVESPEAPLMALNRKFRDHPDTRVRLVGQACLAERLNRLERIVRELEVRADRNVEDADPLLGLCEIHLAVLDQRLLMPQEFMARAHSGLEVVRRLRLLDEVAAVAGTIEYYEARFSLHSGQKDRAERAWSRLVDFEGSQGQLHLGDQFHLLGAEISVIRGDLRAVQKHIRRLEPDTSAKFWMQEFWLEPENVQTS